MTAYPHWRFFPADRRPPAWVADVVSLFGDLRAGLDSRVAHATPVRSNDALELLTPGLEALGFGVERGKTAADKLSRPVFFGDEGRPSLTYEIDAFHADFGIALEIEAGRATMGNAVYRDIIQTSLLIDALYFALAVPIEYRYQSAGRVAREPSYQRTYSVLQAIYGSERLRLPFEGTLLIGF